MAKRKDAPKDVPEGANKRSREDATVAPGYVRLPFRDVDHVMRVAAEVYTGYGLETDPDVLNNLPVNLSIMKDLVSPKRFNVPKWLSRHGVGTSTRSYELHGDR